MIEVEKKFILSPEQTIKLTDGANFLSEREFTDVYYDTNNYSLTTNDIWLRARDGRFELKLPLQSSGNRLADQYKEIEDESEIKQYLKADLGKPLVESLPDLGYQVFCTCKTTRRKYKNGIFVIDLDNVEFPEFNYAIGEIELMVEGVSQVPKAIDQILEFAGQNQLVVAPVRGKVIEYLKRIKPDHYMALVKSGTVVE